MTFSPFRLLSLLLTLCLVLLLGTACLDEEASSNDDDDEDKYTAKIACKNIRDLCTEADGWYTDATYDQCKDDLDNDERCQFKCAVKADDCATAYNCIENTTSADYLEYCGDDPADGDAPDGDQPDGDTPQCSGACNAATDVSYCIAANVCICEGGQWKPYSCSEICSMTGTYSAGCGMQDQGYNYCFCQDEPVDGDVPDGDVPDGDVPDGDVPDGDDPDGDDPDGDDPDGDDPDGDDPLSCEGACTNGVDMPFCSDDTNLCWCDETSNTYGIVDCNQICQSEYGEDGVCDYDSSVQYERCLCGGGSTEVECQSDADCEALGSDYCIGDYDDQGNQITICMDACDIVSCDPGTDAIPCIDYGESGNPFGICFDEEGPDCPTPNDFCGGDENHICMAFQSGDQICMELCNPAPNACGANALCIPLTDSSTGELVGGGCLEL